MVARGRLKGQDKIGVRVGKVVNKYKVAKHFVLEIDDQHFSYRLDEARIAAEAALDGLYVIRTSVAEQRLSAADTVRSYKQLSRVERAFRSMKTMDQLIRPIYHRLEERVRAHILLCMLAYYVQWHMVEAWRELLFCDEDQQAKATRDPVAPAKRSAAALRKVQTRTLDDGTEVHSFQTLLHHLSTIVCNRCQVPGAGPDRPPFEIVTNPNAKQQRAYELLKRITV
jgi:transposase